MPSSRKTRRDPAHTPATELVMRFLLRLWAGDTLIDVGEPELHLSRVGNPEHTFPVPTEYLNELEYVRGWAKTSDDGEQLRVTFAGKAALAQWTRRRHPDKRAMVNEAGERLELRR